MVFIRTTRGGSYQVGSNPEIAIPGVVWVSFDLIRQFQVGTFSTPHIPGERHVVGRFALTELPSVLALYDLTGVAGTQLPSYDLIFRYKDAKQRSGEGSQNKKITFKDPMTGVPGDTAGTFQPLVDDGSPQIHLVTFKLRMPMRDKVSDHVLLENDDS